MSLSAYNFPEGIKREDSDEYALGVPEHPACSSPGKNCSCICFF